MMKQYTFADMLSAVGITPTSESKLIILPFEPFPHQISGFRTTLKWDRCGLYDDAGAGKTFPIQAYCALYALLGNKVVIGMPPALLDQFEESYDNFFVGFRNYIDLAILRGTVKQRDKLIAGWNDTRWPDVLMMTYQMFASLHKLKNQADKTVRKANGSSYIKKGWKKDKQHKLIQHGYNVLVFDESQALKNISSGVTKVVNRYINTADANLLLSTGSPLGNTPEDCYAGIKMITPEVYETKSSFERKHIIRNIHSPFREIIDFQNLDTLHRNVFKQARRVTKEEVTKDLPDKLISAVPVKLSKAHMKLYRELLTARILEFDGKVLDATNNSKLRMTALRLISNPENYIDTGKSIPNEMDASCDTLVDMINPGQNKIIIFSNFKDTVARLQDHYKDLNPVTINSQTKDANKSRLSFTEDPECRMIILNYVSGGVGLNLQVSSHSIFYEPTGVPSQFHQAFARTHRSGQESSFVNGYLLDPAGTYAHKQIGNLLQKDSVANQVIRDPGKLLCELLGDPLNIL